jgi:hypothetical protein
MLLSDFPILVSISKTERLQKARAKATVGGGGIDPEGLEYR